MVVWHIWDQDDTWLRYSRYTFMSILVRLVVGTLIGIHSYLLLTQPQERHSFHTNVDLGTSAIIQLLACADIHWTISRLRLFVYRSSVYCSLQLCNLYYNGVSSSAYSHNCYGLLYRTIFHAKPISSSFKLWSLMHYCWFFSSKNIARSVRTTI